MSEKAAVGSREFEIIGPGGEEIETLDDWRRFGGPKRDFQWADGRSAKELARAWVDGMPADVRQLLDSDDLTRGFTVSTAHPECVTRIDSFRGEHRNHDLVLVGEVDGRPLVVAIEGKADEPFGDTLVEYLERANERKTKTGSKAPDRLDLLTAALLGRTVAEDPSIGTLRFQLFSAAAGTLIEARERGADDAVLLIQEFGSRELDPEKVRMNQGDLEAFVEALGGDAGQLAQGQLVGPLRVPGGEFVRDPVELHIGKLTTKLA